MTVMQTRGQLLEEAFAVAERADPIGDAGQAHAEIIHELRALRLTIAAAIAPQESDETLPELGWIRLELFGHQVAYGFGREVLVGGRRFLELTQPEITAAVDEDGELPVRALVRHELVKRYHPNAVYATEPSTEEDVVAVLSRQAGLHPWQDGTWRTERESVLFDVDMETLGEREDDDAPF